MKSIRINDDLFIGSDIFDFLVNNNHLISSLILQSHTNRDINYVSHGDSGETISYLPMNKYNSLFYDFNPYGRGVGRVKLKIGRFIRKIITEDSLIRYKVKDEDIEFFVNLYKSWFEPINYRLEIVQGEDIRKWYYEDNYALSNFNKSGSIWKSCMRYKERIKFMNLYVENSSCKMLCMIVNQNGRDLIRSRALLWDSVKVIDSRNKDEIGTNIKVMDRIYSTQESDVFLFKKWAFENGYIPKWEQNSKSHAFFDIKGEVVRIFCKIDLDKYKFDTYPYLDTFPWFSMENGSIFNCSFGNNWDYCLVQADGNLTKQDSHQDDDDYPPDDVDGDGGW